MYDEQPQGLRHECSKVSSACQVHTLCGGPNVISTMSIPGVFLRCSSPCCSLSAACAAILNLLRGVSHQIHPFIKQRGQCVLPSISISSMHVGSGPVNSDQLVSHISDILKQPKAPRKQQTHTTCSGTSPELKVHTRSS